MVQLDITNTNDKDKQYINLRWNVPGPAMDVDKIKQIANNFDIWEWEDLRDILYLIGCLINNYETSTITEIKIMDHTRVISLIAQSMYNIQTYIYNKTFDPVAMEARVIVEAVSTYYMEETVQDLSLAFEYIEEINPNLNRLLRKLRRFGCKSVHLNVVSNKNKNIFRINEMTAYSIICTVFDVLNIVRNDIAQKYSTYEQLAIVNLYKNRIKLSANRICLDVIELNKKKSCADESKPEGCCKIGCPYLHRSDTNFSEKNSLENLEIINKMKQKKNKI